ncbi:MAG: HAD family hydrolase [Pseudomonadota bacterium]
MRSTQVEIPPMLRTLRPEREGELVAFDADGVLWPGDMGEDFIEWLLDEGALDARAAWADYRGRYPANDPQGCLVLASFYAGMTPSRLRTQVERFWQQRPPPLDERTTGVMTRLHDAGFEVCVVSGTVRALLLPVLQILPVQHLLALELAVDSPGVYTGAAIGTATFGEGKARALRAVAGSRPVRVAVGNSGLDIAMLELASDLAWAYQPDAALRAAAEAHGWTITETEPLEPPDNLG